MKSLPYWFFALSTLFALAGMFWGLQMAISQDHLLSPGHAHNNLIGFVSMALYGIYYRLVPAAVGRLALVHFVLALAGALTFGPGVAIAILGQGEILAQISTLLVIVSMLVFAWIVWTNKAGLTNP